MKTINLSPQYLSDKELDQETGLYYYGARYLDPKTSRWISADPAVGEYVPRAPIDDEARKHNQNLPGLGGVFNYVNFHVYHYAGNNPVKYTDPDGKWLGFTHRTILNKAFKNTNITGAQLKQMKNASTYTDSGDYQKPEFSYMHSMTDGTTTPKQSVEDAKNKRQEFINEQIAAFVDSNGQDFFALGKALHAISDEDTPAHNWKSWDGASISKPRTLGAAIKHFFSDLFNGLFNKNAKDKSIDKVQAAYQDAMKQVEQKREAGRQLD